MEEAKTRESRTETIEKVITQQGKGERENPRKAGKKTVKRN